MAHENVQSGHAAANEDFRERMLAFEINGVRELYDSPQDAALGITRHMHALSLLLEIAFRKNEQGGSAAEMLNPEIVAGAFDALASMAAMANFFVTETELGHNN